MASLVSGQHVCECSTNNSVELDLRNRIHGIHGVDEPRYAPSSAFIDATTSKGWPSHHLASEYHIQTIYADHGRFVARGKTEYHRYQRHWGHAHYPSQSVTCKSPNPTSCATVSSDLASAIQRSGCDMLSRWLIMPRELPSGWRGRVRCSAIG